MSRCRLVEASILPQGVFSNSITAQLNATVSLFVGALLGWQLQRFSAVYLRQTNVNIQGSWVKETKGTRSEEFRLLTTQFACRV
jgi:hypothetical protein